ncbi:gluconate 2-dehydrogenase subunit 3 family protein [Variovorax sp. J31P207]|uniref:gluconate 2-dehydrogenase subunit 3 family protein n=1 Tax=Variovorax sp. J31P207 TaxID=3053510 RepID=UPI002575B92B|nr:gluconate 2-dehydrogenase subunit 3 family protein [Variovorax sp. J31P207]MDM0066952.1 gluconate 2-dehydrogenase subunit 3 family protein [Variovorax sp. J31P207]
MKDSESVKTRSRRQLFKGMGAATLAVAVFPGCDTRQATTTHGETADNLAQRIYEPRFFTGDEWAFVNAASACLIPKDALGPSAVEVGVPEYIDRQMGTPWAAGALWYMQGPFNADAPAELGFQSQLTPQQIYRLGIAAADGFVQKAQGKSFAQLAADKQDAALHAIESGQAVFETVPAKLFFSMLLQNVREGFFADPVHGGNRGLAGWKLIGFPGARADFMDWVERDVKYPLPPVALNGQRG